MGHPARDDERDRAEEKEGGKIVQLKKERLKREQKSRESSRKMKYAHDDHVF
jgi:hypothetical protein